MRLSSISLHLSFCFVIFACASVFPRTHRSSETRNSPQLENPPSSVKNHSLPVIFANSSLSSSVSQYHASIATSNTSYRAQVWPPFPYRYNIPRTNGRQWLLFIKSDQQDFGPVARTLLLEVCDEMLDWARSFHQHTELNEAHFIQDSTVDGGKGISHSILMTVRPAVEYGSFLPTSLLLDATAMFKVLVRRYGALHGGYQMWEDGRLKGISMVSIIEWPPAGCGCSVSQRGGTMTEVVHKMSLGYKLDELRPFMHDWRLLTLFDTSDS